MEHVNALKVNVGTDPSADLGPVITKEVDNPSLLSASFLYEKGIYLES